MTVLLRYIILVIMLSGFAYPSLAYGYCFEPSAPYYEPVKPITPWCVNTLTNTHTCDDWEIDSYISSMRNYEYEVSQYIDDLNQYIEEAVAYAQCKINNLE